MGTPSLLREKMARLDPRGRRACTPRGRSGLQVRSTTSSPSGTPRRPGVPGGAGRSISRPRSGRSSTPDAGPVTGARRCRAASASTPRRERTSGATPARGGRSRGIRRRASCSSGCRAGTNSTGCPRRANRWPRGNSPPGTLDRGGGLVEFLVPSRPMTPLTDDLAFLRRVTLDTVGVVPTEEEIRRSSPTRRRPAEPGSSTASWPTRAGPTTGSGYWQDVLAENPNILKPDAEQHRAVPLVHPRVVPGQQAVRPVRRPSWSGWTGSELRRRPGRASAWRPQNDAPMAAKAHDPRPRRSSAVDMKCARCHDAPCHAYAQARPVRAGRHARRQAAHGAGDQHGARQPGGPGARRSSRSRSSRATRSPPAWTFAEIAPDELSRRLLPADADAPRAAGGADHLARRTSGSPR